MTLELLCGFALAILAAWMAAETVLHLRLLRLERRRLELEQERVAAVREATAAVDRAVRPPSVSWVPPHGGGHA